ncbi:hypothetical protein BRAS3843_1650017 [Bradyrhizobium sp. STM 3843]|nr:hypothetical protein BRAS3843_1650017 [Bradyrhizobium sp. STM 3843]
MGLMIALSANSQQSPDRNDRFYRQFNSHQAAEMGAVVWTSVNV